MSLMDWEGMRPDRRPLESNVQCPPKRCSCEYVLWDGNSISHRGFAGMPSPHCTCPLGSVSKGKVMREQCPAAFLLGFLQYVASNGFLSLQNIHSALQGRV